MDITRLLVGILLTWSISSLLSTTNDERGPFDLFGKLRDKLGVKYDQSSACYGSNEIASALCCIWCTSLWVGVGVAVLLDLREGVLSVLVMPLVYRAGAIWLQSQIRRGR
jgi:hypothetical protein